MAHNLFLPLGDALFGHQDQPSTRPPGASSQAKQGSTSKPLGAGSAASSSSSSKGGFLGSSQSHVASSSASSSSSSGLIGVARMQLGGSTSNFTDSYAAGKFQAAKIARGEFANAVPPRKGLGLSKEDKADYPWDGSGFENDLLLVDDEEGQQMARAIKRGRARKKRREQFIPGAEEAIIDENFTALADHAGGRQATIATLARDLKIKRQNAYPMGERIFIGLLGEKLQEEGKKKRRGRLFIPAAARIIWANPKLERRYFEVLLRGMAMAKSYFSSKERKDLFSDFTAVRIKQAVKAKVGASEMKRLRAAGGGRKVIAPEMHEDLYEIFLHLRCMGAKTTVQLLIRIGAALRSMRQQDGLPVPTVNRDWVVRWMISYELSLRIPNTRPKLDVESQVMRTLATWKTTWGVLALLRRLGYRVTISNIDEKPVFMNQTSEGGVVAQVGARHVRILENHGQTRSRYTVLTHVSTQASETQPPPYIEVLMRGGETVEKKLQRTRTKVVNDGELPGVSLGVRTGPKGSYDRSTFLPAVKKVVDSAPKGEKCVTLVLFDHFRGHEISQDDLVPMGALFNFIGAGITDLLQVNDSHLHGDFSREYKLEEGISDAAHFLSIENVGEARAPITTREDALRSVCRVWKRLVHQKYARGFRENGMEPGARDDEIRTALREWWIRSAAIRSKIVAEAEQRADELAQQDKSRDDIIRVCIAEYHEKYKPEGDIGCDIDRILENHYDGWVEARKQRALERRQAKLARRASAELDLDGQPGGLSSSSSSGSSSSSSEDFQSGSDDDDFDDAAGVVSSTSLVKPVLDSFAIAGERSSCPTAGSIWLEQSIADGNRNSEPTTRHEKLGVVVARLRELGEHGHADAILRKARMAEKTAVAAADAREAGGGLALDAEDQGGNEAGDGEQRAQSHRGKGTAYARLMESLKSSTAVRDAAQKRMEERAEQVRFEGYYNRFKSKRDDDNNKKALVFTSNNFKSVQNLEDTLVHLLQMGPGSKLGRQVAQYMADVVKREKAKAQLKRTGDGTNLPHHCFLVDRHLHPIEVADFSQFCSNVCNALHGKLRTMGVGSLERAHFIEKIVRSLLSWQANYAQRGGRAMPVNPLAARHETTKAPGRKPVNPAAPVTLLKSGGSVGNVAAASSSKPTVSAASSASRPRQIQQSQAKPQAVPARAAASSSSTSASSSSRILMGAKGMGKGVASFGSAVAVPPSNSRRPCDLPEPAAKKQRVEEGAKKATHSKPGV
ncbi:unnamed protein product [Amoebophrya sp. A25]|nr:unnamed protein product [Amoebophrya sp. A25]|eukprot:GSA25T00020243001.1